MAVDGGGDSDTTRLPLFGSHTHSHEPADLFLPAVQVAKTFGEAADRRCPKISKEDSHVPRGC